MSDPIAHGHGYLDGQIDRTTREFDLQISALDARRRNRHARGGVCEAAQQRRENQDLSVFPHRQVKVPPRIFRNEVATRAEVQVDLA